MYDVTFFCNFVRLSKKRQKEKRLRQELIKERETEKEEFGLRGEEGRIEEERKE